MKYLLTLTLVLLIGCSNPTETATCEEYTFLQFVSYVDTQAYRFEKDNKQYFFFSEELLSLEEGEEYCLIIDDEYIKYID